MLFHLLWRMGAFLCQHESSKNSFSAVVYTACNITHTIEKNPLLRFLSAQKTFFCWFYMKEHHWLCTTEIIPPLHKTALPTAQSFFTKSNDGTVTAHHVPFAREKSLISSTSVWTLYINIPSQYDIVSMAKRFHIGFYAKCKKCDKMYMCCICRLEEEAFWGTPWQNQQNALCAQRRLISAWASMVVFIAIAWDDTSILVAVHFSMKNIYQFCDRGRAVMWSNVGVSQ